MDAKQFSQAEFEKRGRDSEAARQLADELQEAVLARVDEAIQGEITKIVDELNRVGHRLETYVRSPGELAFRDDNRADKECRLRLAVDVVVSAGYAHLIKAD